MAKEHYYNLSIKWEGNLGEGTKNYQAYLRDHSIQIAGKAKLSASSDPAFRGDASKYNPEELFLASISSCHMLWYLHLCANAGIVVQSYQDEAYGIMEESAKGSGRFTKVLLRPKIVITDDSKTQEAMGLHRTANEHCFIANSCNFPIDHEAVVRAIE